MKKLTRETRKMAIFWGASAARKAELAVAFDEEAERYAEEAATDAASLDHTYEYLPIFTPVWG